jgi:hypothetical protein
LCSVTFIGLVYLTSYKNFFYDEWDFVTAFRPSQSTSILFPHNEHWSTIPILIWKVLFVVFGLRSHWPYEAAALAAHVACVVLLFTLIRRRSGDLPAFAAAATLLVLGTGATDIVWAFQVAWTLSIAFGLIAMLVVDRSPSNLIPWRVVAVSAALLCSLMSSGIGLGFLAAVTVQLLADPSRRRYVIAVIVPIAAYLAWFLLYGAGLAGTPGQPCPTCPTAFGTDLRALQPEYIAGVAAYVALGLEGSAAGIVGLVGPIGQAVLVALGVLLSWHWYTQRGKVESWELGLIAGLLAQFTLIGLVRVRLGLEGARDPHYIYVGAVYLLPLVVNALKQLPWRGLWRPLLAGGFFLTLLGNATLLVDQSIGQLDWMQTQNAKLRALELFRGAPDMALDRPLDDLIMPQLTASRYFAAIDELGSAVPDSTPHSLQNLPFQAVDRELLVLFGDALKVTAGGQASTQAPPCQTIDSRTGSIMNLQVMSNRSFVMTASTGGQALISLGFLGPPPSEALKQVQLTAGSPIRVQLPDTGRPVLWRVRLTTNSVGQLEVCGAENIRSVTSNAVFSAAAAGGALDPGWISEPDAAALGGLAAKLRAETTTDSYKNDIFGTPVALPSGAYDVWFRVRVTAASGDKGEMTLGMWDYTAWRWVGSTTFRANQVSNVYTWVKVANGSTPAEGHRLVFIAEFANHSAPLTTDWYIDQAVVVPVGAPAPI